MFRTTTLLRRTAAVYALLLITVPPLRAEYLAETGRTEKVGIDASATSIGQDDLDADASGKVFELKPAEVYFPEVEKALLAGGIDKLPVQSEGVNTTLRTFAEIQVDAVTGRSRFEKQDPIYTVLGMIYQNQLWVRVPIIPVEDPKLAERFGLDPKKHNRVSPVWVMKTPAVREPVMAVLGGDDSIIKSWPGDQQKALRKFSYRVATFLNITGEFKLAPLRNAGGAWVSPFYIERPELAAQSPLSDKIAAVDKTQEPYASMMALHNAVKASYEEQKAINLQPEISALIGNAIKVPDYMPTLTQKLDHLNTLFRPFQKSAWIYLAAFLLFVIHLALGKKRGGGAAAAAGLTEVEVAPAPRYESALTMSAMSPSPALAGGPGGASSGAIPPIIMRTPVGYGDPVLEAEIESRQGSKTTWAVAYSVMGLAVLMLIFALVTRFILSGRMPVSNMYESLTFALGAFAVVSFVFEGVYRRGWVGAGASLFGYVLMMLINSLPLHMRKVEPLVAVLKSVWLNFHVTSLLVSYSCFLLGFVFCLLYWLKQFTGNRPGMLPRKEMFEYLCYRSVQVGWPLLTLGIFLGAVWANTAWGSFWSWDPKETWALITWLTYTIYLHFRMIHGWTGGRSVTAAMIGFGMVLVTYFGVSYLPGLAGGMHSYAEPISR